MNIEEASNLINRVPKGFRVSFWHIEGIMRRSGYFPENGFIPHEELAWTWARLLAESSPGILVDLFVVDHNRQPVPGHEERKIKNRIKPEQE